MAGERQTEAPVRSPFARWLRDYGVFLSVIATFVALLFTMVDRIDGLRTEFDSKLDAVAASLDEVKTKVEVLDARFTDRMAAMDERLGGRMDALDARMDSLDRRMVRLERKLDETQATVNKRIDDVLLVLGREPAPRGESAPARTPIPLVSLFPGLLTGERVFLMGKVVPSRVEGDELTLFADDEQVRKLLVEKGWRPVDPADPAAGYRFSRPAKNNL